MNILLAVGIYCILNAEQRDAHPTSKKPYFCLVNLKKLARSLDKMGRTCLSKKAIIHKIKQVRTTCKEHCENTWSLRKEVHVDFREWQRNSKNIFLKITLNLNDQSVIRKGYHEQDCTEQNPGRAEFNCTITIRPKDIMQIINFFLDIQDRSTTPNDKQSITTLTAAGYTDHPKDRSRDGQSDCTGIAVGIGFLGAVAGVIITSTLCICWIRFKRPKRDLEGQAITNKTYGISGDEKVDDVGSKPRQRSVVYSEINDDPTHGHPNVSQVAPIMRDTEEKPNRAINDRDVYNHLNEQVNKDDADDYDHARPVPIQNNDTDNADGKLDKMAAIPKSIPGDKRISSSSVNHDYGELEIVEPEGVKRPDNATKNSGTDDSVGNDDNDNYFTLEKSQT